MVATALNVQYKLTYPDYACVFVIIVFLFVKNTRVLRYRIECYAQRLIGYFSVVIFLFCAIIFRHCTLQCYYNSVFPGNFVVCDRVDRSKTAFMCIEHDSENKMYVHVFRSNRTQNYKSITWNTLYAFRSSYFQIYFILH